MDNDDTTRSELEEWQQRTWAVDLRKGPLSTKTMPKRPAPVPTPPPSPSSTTGTVWSDLWLVPVVMVVGAAIVWAAATGYLLFLLLVGGPIVYLVVAGIKYTYDGRPAPLSAPPRVLNPTSIDRFIQWLEWRDAYPHPESLQRRWQDATDGRDMRLVGRDAVRTLLALVLIGAVVSMNLLIVFAMLRLIHPGWIASPLLYAAIGAGGVCLVLLVVRHWVAITTAILCAGFWIIVFWVWLRAFGN